MPSRPSASLEELTSEVLARHPDCGAVRSLLRIGPDVSDPEAALRKTLQPEPKRLFGRTHRRDAQPTAPVQEIEQAGNDLGFRTGHAVALAWATIETLHAEGDQIDPVAFWRHAAAVGVLALVAAESYAVHQDRAFAAGFFYPIGLLMLDRFRHGELTEVRRRCIEQGVARAHAERTVFGFDESQLGAALAGHWKLPEWLIDAIAHAHAPPLAAGSPRELSSIVWQARAAAQARGYGDGEGEGAMRARHASWLVDPLLDTLDRLGGTPWLEMRVSRILAPALLDAGDA